MRPFVVLSLVLLGLGAGVALSRPASAGDTAPVCEQRNYRMGQDFGVEIAGVIAAQRAKGLTSTDVEISNGAAMICSW